MFQPPIFTGTDHTWYEERLATTRGTFYATKNWGGCIPSGPYLMSESWIKQELKKTNKELIKYPRRADLKLRSLELQRALNEITKSGMKRP